MDVIRVKELYKIYPSQKNIIRNFFNLNIYEEGIPAISNLNLSIEQGDFYGLLGHNGAGKTTLIRMLSGLLRPTSGEIKILNKDIFKHEKEVKSKLGIVIGGDRSLYWKLTGKENLDFFATLYNVDAKNREKEIDNVLNYVGLYEKRNMYVETYSKGMKQRLLIAKALLHHPEILLLDEPTVGLDVTSAHELRNLLMILNQELKTTILLTTHYLYEAEQLCNRIGILKNGHLIKEGNLEELKKIYDEETVLIVKVNEVEKDLVKLFVNFNFINRVTKKEFDVSNNTYTYEMSYNKEHTNAFNLIIKTLQDHSIPIISLENVMPTLEDVFIKLMSENMGEMKNA